MLIFAVVMILTMRFVQGGFMEIIRILSPRLAESYLRLIGRTEKGVIKPGP
jgi:hypothetical protein